MPKQTWIIAGVLSAVVLIIVVAASLRKQSVENARLEQALNEVQALLEKRTADYDSLSNRLEEARALAENLAAEKKEAVATQQSLEDEMRQALESKDVTISELKGKLTVNILDSILFDSGEAILKPEGEHMLEKIAGVVSQHTNRQIHIVGHTDDIPIRRKFASNWELSTARATAAVRFLQEKAGVDPSRLAGMTPHSAFGPSLASSSSSSSSVSAA